MDSKTAIFGKSWDTDTGSSLTSFKISVESSGLYDGDIPKRSWHFENREGCWYVIRTDHHYGIEGTRRKKHKSQVSPRSIKKFLSVLHATSIPLALRFEMGCDGGFTELEYGDAGGGLKLRWWSAPPKELEALDEAISELLEESTDA